MKLSKPLLILLIVIVIMSGVVATVSSKKGVANVGVQTNAEPRDALTGQDMIDNFQDGALGQALDDTGQVVQDGGNEGPNCFIRLGDDGTSTGENGWWVCDDGTGGDNVLNPVTNEEGPAPYTYEELAINNPLLTEGVDTTLYAPDGSVIEAGNVLYRLYSGQCSGSILTAWNTSTCSQFDQIIYNLNSHGFGNITTGMWGNTAVSCNNITGYANINLSGANYTASHQQCNLGAVGINNELESTRGSN